jgi:hypothetical protein
MPFFCGSSEGDPTITEGSGGTPFGWDPREGDHGRRGDVHQHEDAAAARRCQAGETWICGWQYQVYVEGEPYIRGCTGAAWDTGRGFTCEWGHEHVTAEVRHAEGWDYAADPEEAGLLAGVGVQPVAMNGGGIDIDPGAMQYAMSI